MLNHLDERNRTGSPISKNMKNIPDIGQQYNIFEGSKMLTGVVESYQGETGKFWVKWSDGEMTLESDMEKYK